MHVQIILKCFNTLRRIKWTCYDFCKIIEDSKTKMYLIITRKSKIHIHLRSTLIHFAKVLIVEYGKDKLFVFIQILPKIVLVRHWDLTSIFFFLHSSIWDYNINIHERKKLYDQFEDPMHESLIRQNKTFKYANLINNSCHLNTLEVASSKNIKMASEFDDTNSWITNNSEVFISFNCWLWHRLCILH